MGSKRTIFIIVLIFILSVLAYEAAMRWRRGPVPWEGQRPLFKEQYEDIYGKFFKRIDLAAGPVYQAQRRQEVEESFPAQKTKGSRRIFVLGGSVAYSFSRQEDRQYIKGLLENALPAEKFEIIGCGMAAYDSYRESLIHKEILDYSPDLIVLLSGNNEFFFPVRFNLTAYRLNRLLRRTYAYRDLQDNFANWCKSRRICPGIDPDRRQAEFEKNLKRMIRRAKGKKVPMLLCTLPVNYLTAPSGSPDWADKEFALAWSSLNKKDFLLAREGFERFIAAHPKDPFGHYFLAQCHEGLKDYPQAQEYYRKAISLDIDPGDRCPPERNAIIRRLSSQKGVLLADLEMLFIKMAPHGLPADEFFVDHCHWWNEYLPIVYEEIARPIIAYYKSGSRHPALALDKDQERGNARRPDFPSAKKETLKAKAFRKLLGESSGVCFQALRMEKEGWESPDCRADFLSERLVSSVQKAYLWQPDLFTDRPRMQKAILKEVSRNPWLPEDILEDFPKAWMIILYHSAEALRRLGLYPLALEYADAAVELGNFDVSMPYLSRALIYFQLGKEFEARKDLQEVSKKSCRNPLIGSYREILGIREQ